MATVGSPAAHGVAQLPRGEEAGAEPRSAWPARRERRQAARLASAGRLDAALARVVELEGQVLVLEAQLVGERERYAAAAEQAMALAVRQGGIASPQAALQEELVVRMALAAPVLEAR